MFYGTCTEKTTKKMALVVKTKKWEASKRNKSEKSNIETGDEKNVIY